MAEAVEKTLETPYGAVHYWITRTGKADLWLVLLPGLTADHHLFDRQVEELGEKYNCLTWDAPAHGVSRPFQLRFSLRDMARYLHDILVREEVGSPILVGQSMGGYVAQVYISMFPGTVSGFVSIDSCSLDRKYYTGWELALLKRTKWMYLSIPWKLLIKWGSNGTAESVYGRRLMKRTMESFEKREYCELADHGYRIFAEAVETGGGHQLRCPVLLLCGDKDAAGSAKRYNRRWAEQDGHKLVWLAGAGHNSNTDQPETVNRLIADFAAAAAGERALVEPAVVT